MTNNQSILNETFNARHWEVQNPNKARDIVTARIVEELPPGQERRQQLKMVGAELYPDDFEAPSLKQMGQMTLSFSDQLTLFAYSDLTEYNDLKLPETATSRSLTTTGLDNVAEVETFFTDQPDQKDGSGSQEAEPFCLATA